MSPLEALGALLPGPPLHIVDVGANPMRRAAPWAPLLRAGLARVTGFEPQPGAEPAPAPGVRLLPFAIGDGGRHRLRLFAGSGLASLLPIRRETVAHLRGLRRAARPTGEIEVETVRLDDVPDLGRVDFLKIDIQGAETMAFDHAPRVLAEAAAVQAEVSFLPLYEGQPGFGEVDLRLRAAGLLPARFMHLVERRILSQRGRALAAPPRQLLDGDMVWTRDLSRAETLPDETLRALALLAFAVFDMPDAALKALEALEARGRVDGAALDGWAAGLPAAGFTSSARPSSS